MKREWKLSAILVESVILFPSLSLKKSGNLVCLFLPRRLFKVFHVCLILNLFVSISAVMYDFLEVGNKLFSRFLNLVYLILFSKVGLVMYFSYNLVLIDFRIPGVTQGLRGVLRLEIFIVFIGQWILNNSII